jgi:hypothetical protein
VVNGARQAGKGTLSRSDSAVIPLRSQFPQARIRRFADVGVRRSCQAAVTCRPREETMFRIRRSVLAAGAAVALIAALGQVLGG